MQSRKDALENEYYYHVYNRSIAGYTIFNDDSDYSRIIELLNLYRHTDFNYKYSTFCNLTVPTQVGILASLELKQDLLADIVAFCIMPTHIHLLLKQKQKNGISKYMSKVLNSYSRYFNTRHNRLGPLWTGRFKSVLVENDAQLLHLTRYIHLNPTSANLTQRPTDWPHSSLDEYIDEDHNKSKLCSFTGLFDLTSQQYLQFVYDNQSYQQNLAIIKSQLIDDYSG